MFFCILRLSWKIREPVRQNFKGNASEKGDCKAGRWAIRTWWGCWNNRCTCLPKGRSEYEPKKISSRTWRECIKKIWEVDPLECSNCGGEMKIISFITEASVIRQILEHLNLRAERLSRDPPEWGLISEDKVVVREPLDDGWGQYDERYSFPCHSKWSVWVISITFRR